MRTKADYSYIEAFLARRGLTSSDVDYLIEPKESHQHDPFLLRGMSEWVDVLHKQKGKAISIIPDYDADGVLSGTLARVGLSVLGFGDVYVCPPKTSEGYGLTRTSVDRVLTARPDTQVIITTDNGSNAHDGISYAKEKGLVVLVTDHHLAKDRLGADAHVNPNYHAEGSETYPFLNISGTTVIYKALLAYAKQYQHDSYTEQAFRDLIFLVGISVVSDVMPLLNENRYYVTEAVAMFKRFVASHTLERIDQYDDTPLNQYYRGVDLLVYTLNKQGKLRYGITSDTFGFLIGPMLNSPRRMVGDSELAFRLFQTTWSDSDKGVLSPADALYDLNEERKQYVRELTRGLIETVEKSTDPIDFTAFSAVCRGGVVGLLAGEFTRRYGLPCIAFGLPENETLGQTDGAINPERVGMTGVVSGSGRAPLGFDLHGFLSALDQTYPGLIETWGGHAQAAGLSVRASQLDTFRSVFTYHLADLFTKEADGAKEAVRVLPISPDFLFDTPCSKRVLDMYSIDDTPILIETSPSERVVSDDRLLTLIDYLENLEPYGHGFRAPVFGLIFRMDQVNKRLMGADNQHVKLTFPNGLALICWHGADVFDYNGFGDDFRTFAVQGDLSVNHFNGQDTLQVVAEKVEELND